MTEDTEKFSVHSTKLYRVVLEGIDRNRETPATFALKLAMRMRTPLPRCKQVVRNLPYAIKSGLTASQANRFSSILKELGGEVSVEAYVVGPEVGKGPTSPPQPEPPIDTPQYQAKPDSGGRPQEKDPKGEPEGVLERDIPDSGGDEPKVTCPECGWEEPADASHCSMCLRRFRRADRRPRSLGARIPHENPLGSELRNPDEPEGTKEITTGDYVYQYGRYVVVIAIIFVLLFYLTK